MKRESYKTQRNLRVTYLRKTKKKYFSILYPTLISDNKKSFWKKVNFALRKLAEIFNNYFSIIVKLLYIRQETELVYSHGNKSSSLVLTVIEKLEKLPQYLFYK